MDASAIDAGANDGGVDGGVDCEALRARVDADRTVARACRLASGECTTTVDDVCGCPVFVAVGGSAAAGTFAASVDELRRSGCPRLCTNCPAQPVSGTCLQVSGGSPACWP